MSEFEAFTAMGGALLSIYAVLWAWGLVKQLISGSV